MFCLNYEGEDSWRFGSKDVIDFSIILLQRGELPFQERLSGPGLTGFDVEKLADGRNGSFRVFRLVRTFLYEQGDRTSAIETIHTTRPGVEISVGGSLVDRWQLIVPDGCLSG